MGERPKALATRVYFAQCPGGLGSPTAGHAPGQENKQTHKVLSGRQHTNNARCRQFGDKDDWPRFDMTGTKWPSGCVFISWLYLHESADVKWPLEDLRAFKPKTKPIALKSVPIHSDPCVTE